MQTRWKQKQPETITCQQSADDESDQESTPASDDDNASVRAPPRKRHATGKASGDQKAVQKKRGRLAGFLNLPVDVFHMIASYLSPGDILTLSRSNKFFRSVLMQRSSIYIWKAAERNIEGLPPCPVGLSEPQYVSLLFSKSCSGCGGYLARGMDPYLQVRLCNPCRDEQVIEVKDLDESTKDLVHKTKLTALKPSRYGEETCLRSDVELVMQKLSGFSGKGNRATKQRDKWVESRMRECKLRARDGHKLQKYLDESADSRSKEIDTLKTQRRNDLIERLENAGWSQEDYKFTREVAREWVVLVESPKLLTDRMWQNLYPKLLPILQANRARQEKLGRITRRRARRQKLQALLQEIRSSQVLLELEHEVLPETTHADLVGVNGDNGVIGIHTSAATSTSTFMAAFPSDGQAYLLPVICDIFNADTEVDEFTQAFEASRSEILNSIQAWRSKAEEELVSILTRDFFETSEEESNLEEDVKNEESSVSAHSIQDTSASTTDSAESEQNSSLVSLNTRTLLRADSVFCIPGTKEYPSVLVFYPELFSRLENKASEEVYVECYLSVHRPPSYLWKATDVEKHPEAKLVAESLLQDIERPDATAFELMVLGKYFMCGRCKEKRPRKWNEMVQHFVEARAHCRAAKSCDLPAKKTIVYNDHHTLDPIYQSKGKKKPLVVLMSVEEAKFAASKYNPRLFVTCNPCADLEIDFRCARDGMIRHLKDVHDIKDPKAANWTRSYEEDAPYLHHAMDPYEEWELNTEYQESSFEYHLRHDKSAAWWIDYPGEWMSQRLLRDGLDSVSVESV